MYCKLVLVTVLVFFSALLVVFLFGGKLAKFFNSESSVSQSAGKGTIAINPTGGSKYNNPIDNYTGPTNTLGKPAVDTTGGTNHLTSGPPNITTSPDGSVTMTVSGQEVTINKDIQNLANAMFTSSPVVTTGSTGSTQLMQEIAKIIETYKSEYPDQDVPVNVSFGNSNVTFTGIKDGESEKTYNVNGVAAANTATIKVGSHIVILQNDQCNSNVLLCNTVSHSRRFVGELDKDALSGTVTVSNAQNSETMDVKSNVTIKNGVLSSVSGEIKDPLLEGLEGFKDVKNKFEMNFNQSFKL